MVEWNRIIRQTGTLTWKNLLVFYKSPIASVIKAILVPIIVTLVFSFLKDIKSSGAGTPYDFSHTGREVLALSDAMAAASSQRLVVATNGIHDTQLNNSINAIFQESGMSQFDLELVDSPNVIFDSCKQSIHGTSLCFAAVVFTAFNSTHAEYVVGLDGDFLTNSPTSAEPGQSVLSKRIMPLQWALNAQIGGFKTTQRPTEKMWDGYIYVTEFEPEEDAGAYWLSLINLIVSPIFVFIFIITTYHIGSAVASERQSGVVELLMAQGVTTTPRILSNLLSFSALYIPGIIICSIILGEVLFVNTSTGLIFILMVLAGLSFIVTSHFIGSFFSKSSVSGMCTCILMVALAFVSLSESLAYYKDTGQMLGLSIVFPPYAFSTFIRDIAGTEESMKAWPNAAIAQEDTMMDGYLYFVCFLIHIFGYGALIFLVEHLRWGVPQRREWSETSDQVALKLTNLSKTYGKKEAVKDFNAEVQHGSVTFLLGPNGSGKTTALKCISGVLNVDDGSKIQFSRDGRSLGLCPQHNVLWDELTIVEHVRLWASLKGIGNTPSAQEIDDVIAECDLTEKAHAAAGTLSGGQKRRLQLAIAFAGGSKVVCIDEASSGLDPLSRRNIWNIIQEGRRHRTTVLTTHFLDEADVLADHIVIMCKGSLVCQGSSIALRAQYGDNYRIRVDDDQETTWRAANSAEATQKILELERLRPDLACHVTFPTLEQVFLRTTSEFGTAVDGTAEDGMVGEGQNTEDDSNTVLEDKILALESEFTGEDLNLDVRQSVGMFWQIWVLFRKRYQLLYRASGMIVYAVNLLLPIILAAALATFFASWDALVTCEDSYNKYIHPVGKDIAPFDAQSIMASTMQYEVLGPTKQFQGGVQDALFVDTLDYLTYDMTDAELLKSRNYTDSEDQFNSDMEKAQGDAGFGIYAPTTQSAVLYHAAAYTSAETGMSGLDLITNRIANSTSNNQARQIRARLRTMSHVEPAHNDLDMPVAILIVLAMIASVSTSVIYPIYERVSNVRALQYSNGVSPFALWTAYLLFDTQFIIMESLVVYGLLFILPTNTVWYSPSAIFGAFVLFGIASYLGCYLLSNVIRRGGYAAALGIHIILFVIYIVAYVGNQEGSAADDVQDIYNSLQAGLGLICPAANLARALWVGRNTFDVLCGKYGQADVSYPFAYAIYGGVYANLTYQIIFLSLVIGIYEYAGTGWFQPLLFWRRKSPMRLHHRVDDGLTSFDSRRDIVLEDSRIHAPRVSDESSILNVSRVSKFFSRSFVAQNISFSISPNQTLALLGSNGAGKTTVINMIRGELRPDFGDIFVNGMSVLTHLRKARLNIGVCPQDDAVDNLTVRQTLEFYAAVKGLQRVKENVDQVLRALDITQYAKVTARALSGGTKRKLTVAIAILGNPPLLLLDEPSTGQDAGAKRILWRALQRIRANRAILFTTHSMEEAEALASKVAIMRTSLLVCGPLQTLNDTYGGAFRLRGSRCENVSADAARKKVYDVFSNMDLPISRYEDTRGIVQFFIKYEKKDLGKILSAMESLKVNDSEKHGAQGHGGSGSARPTESEMKMFEDYTLTEPTLEEVFMNVVKEGE
ncbi:hypothetical protein N7456_009751 [Penicillium angulare]|uniref:ABC transporter domain-containing protein n=1 Tax=Penicillium angulare TaxID=116970 RepID=A0A9W9F595_9EURO|nr:hypothetical protein N7456_009751 [Penicillium angulare]